MAKKNKINLSFNYTSWACCVTEDQMTGSIAKMKKIVKDDIKETLANGYKKHGEKESPFTLDIPFFGVMDVNKDVKVNVDFADNCKFKCEKISSKPKDNTEYGEISVFGNINVAIVWKI